MAIALVPDKIQKQLLTEEELIARMNVMKAASLSLALCLGSLSPVARAAVFNFYPATSAGEGQLNTSATYTSGANSIIAYGFACSSWFGGATDCLNNSNALNWYADVNATRLYQKNDGSAEKGLGIKNDPLGDHEISQDDFIDLDLTNLGATTGTLTISSLQQGESFMFCYGNSHSTWNSNGCSTTFLGTGGDMTVAFNLGNYHDLSLIGVNNDVLLESLTTTAPTPEPSSLALLGTGLLGAMGAVRRRMQKVTA